MHFDDSVEASRHEFVATIADSTMGSCAHVTSANYLFGPLLPLGVLSISDVHTLRGSSLVREVASDNIL